ncbi:NAD(P)H-dependent oxidoreductase [Fructilactobacillus carniphilus]|uniref:NAD(P)H-dependent oxidoreductase n=1 Tax=Fructilactobacillus carniphilus TaxID=2940297 RepID=A0ABY5BZM5_9LACO|nr:NAD(P)H-dependent oxidoreductase [Fructilactobacillus carniphilus]USS91305.1 NAD(P)H-dependent oxidoreductase [Fructilactobacillus carniphilus]
MKTLVIYAHPYSQSFNHAIFNTVTTELQSNHMEFQTLDLYLEQFNPAFSQSELALYHEGKALDPLVKKYQQAFKEAQQVIFIFPIWWNDVPAIVKGLVDKVMLPHFSYEEKATGLTGQLTNIKQTYVITTSKGPTFYLKYMMGNHLQRVFVNQTLKQVGMRNRHWVNFGSIKKSTPQSRERFLQKIERLPILKSNPY